MSMQTILLVDDEPAFQRLCGNWLASLGYVVKVAATAEQVHALLAENSFDLVLLDLALPPSFTPDEGLALLPAFAPVPVVVMTGHADRELALRAISLGAWDFLPKPLDPDILRVVVDRALNKSRLERELAVWRARALPDDNSMGLIGISAELAELRSLIRRIAPTDVPVMITGPSGTGKELVARALHAQGKRAGKAFIAVHCGAIPAELFESELFGHCKGSFTGADRDRKGLIAAADGGTLFLDEVGEMPLPMQVKLLRFLQSGSFFPIGARAELRVDVRIVAATNRDLAVMVEEKSFRDDLYYRLKGIQMRTLALADRAEDIALIAQAIAARSTPPKRLTAAAQEWLVSHAWPGNVRELQHCLQTAMALAGEMNEIVVDDLALACGEVASDAPVVDTGLLEEQVAALEKRLIVGALNDNQHNHTHAAKQLGISRVGLLNKMRRYGLRE
ncbi:sigma-54-dependent transcriptional regulator [Undibacterium sp. Tian12W]|uniref:sigma-54-dependent transcriptional regulator n=1 Tax=Undibacterium sp. Tian12W TaxID=3413054 RepID=UPI003BF362CB